MTMHNRRRLRLIFIQSFGEEGGDESFVLNDKEKETSIGTSKRVPGSQEGVRQSKFSTEVRETRINNQL